MLQQPGCRRVRRGVVHGCLPLVGLVLLLLQASVHAAAPGRPNILLIYGDDIGYGDVGCYGATRVSTPNVDRLAREGLRFTSGYSAAATCTPSRYAMLTGEYAFRRQGTGVLAGNAAMIIEPGRITLPALLRRAGYRTGVVGKWHLGLGQGQPELDWNGDITPGPLDIGFEYAFLMPATGDRVPCVYVEDRRVAGLDPADPIQVSYRTPFPGLPTGVTHREQLKLDWSHGHNQAVVNGIGRIGYMKGGTAALWVDEDMADRFVAKAVAFIEARKASEQPFFLYFATHDVHVPRVPHPRFVGKTDMGPRGDVIVQFDWCVGELLDALDRLGLARDTLVLLSSDNGPVLDDGYKDGAVERLGDHRPAGPWRGGKYSRFEGGTRMPFLVRWPARVKPGQTDAIVTQVDLLASFAALTDQPLAAADGPDSLNVLLALLGESATGREYVVEHAGGLALRRGQWKYIEPGGGRRANPERGGGPKPQLFDLAVDPGETTNLADRHPERVQELAALLQTIREGGRTRP
ncbi:MAG: arylsulfatase [Lentisphaeria bacterium]|nr:arylsulfatase [Lentisphaeria bacterium]